MTASSDETAAPKKSGGVGAIIVAAGSSRRMGGGDKLWVSLGGRPLLAHTLAIFQHCPSIHKIVLVLAPGREKLGQTLIKHSLLNKVVAICAGGEERQDSVRAGIVALGPCEWVVVHDGARPLVTRELIDKGLAAARATGAATCAVPLHDSIKLVSDEGLVEKSLDRRRLWQVQTPQVFRYELLVEAHRAAAKQPPASDDATLVERLGRQVKAYMGSYHNIKVTTPDDMVIAQILIRWHRG